MIYKREKKEVAPWTYKTIPFGFNIVHAGLDMFGNPTKTYIEPVEGYDGETCSAEIKRNEETETVNVCVNDGIPWEYGLEINNVTARVYTKSVIPEISFYVSEGGAVLTNGRFSGEIKVGDVIRVWPDYTVKRGNETQYTKRLKMVSGFLCNPDGSVHDNLILTDTGGVQCDLIMEVQ